MGFLLNNQPTVEAPSMPSIPTNASTQPPPRPYTEYNFFFQLEREYILQNNLGVYPKLRSDEIFSISDPNYEGPSLPEKYDGLTLPSDWYLPGKGRRKKRQHVATHGKISFTDLSKSVAAAWRNRDEETKNFTKKLVTLGMQKYKRDLKAHTVLLKSQSKKVKGGKIQKKPSTNKAKKNDLTPKNDIISCNMTNVSIVSPAPALPPLPMHTPSMAPINYGGCGFQAMNCVPNIIHQPQDNNVGIHGSNLLDMPLNDIQNEVESPVDEQTNCQDVDINDNDILAMYINFCST